MSEEGQSISKEDEERLSALFNVIDRNKDGRIDIDDLSALLTSKNLPSASDTAKVCFSATVLIYIGFMYFNYMTVILSNMANFSEFVSFLR